MGSPTYSGSRGQVEAPDLLTPRPVTWALSSECLSVTPIAQENLLLGHTSTDNV